MSDVDVFETANCLCDGGPPHYTICLAQVRAICLTYSTIPAHSHVQNTHETMLTPTLSSVKAPRTACVRGWDAKLNTKYQCYQFYQRCLKFEGSNRTDVLLMYSTSPWGQIYCMFTPGPQTVRYIGPAVNLAPKQTCKVSSKTCTVQRRC